MKVTTLLHCFLLAGIATFYAPSAFAQGSHNRGPISHHTDGYEKGRDDEYRMSHLDGDAGDLIAIVLPKRIQDLPIKSGRWQSAESEKVRVEEYTSTSATLRLLASGTTVVNYKYHYMRDGKEESAAYPFTIRVHRIEPETISVPSTIYLGWDLSENLENKIHLLPKYSECPTTFTIEDPAIADIEEGYIGPRITGRQIGETTLYIETSNGLHAETRVLVQVPELKSIDLKTTSKQFSVGDRMMLDVKLSPQRAQPILTWSSDKPEIASVDQNGVVTAVAEGKTTIRVVSDNGKKESITIKVKN